MIKTKDSKCKENSKIHKPSHNKKFNNNNNNNNNYLLLY